MPATIQSKAGPLVSTEHQWASQDNTQLVVVLRDFATDENGPLKLPDTATNQEVLNAINAFAGQRVYNYIRNWYRNKQRQLAEAEIEQQNPLDSAP